MKDIEHIREEHTVRNLVNIARGISSIFGRNCEVVIHSLESPETSVIAIENGHVTGRKAGDSALDLDLHLLEESAPGDGDVFGSYFRTHRNGRRLKSVTVVLRGPGGNPSGLLCINFDTSAPLDSVLSDLLHAAADTETSTGHPGTVRDLIDVAYGQARQRVNSLNGLSATEQNLCIVKELYNRGIFNVKNGVDIIADNLGISRYTIYNYIRDIKLKDNP